MTSSCAEELLDVLGAFVGHLHCGAQGGGIDALRSADLTFSQMRTLLMLTRNPHPVPIHEIATGLGLSVAAAGRNVDQLVRAGFVERHEDDLDRRIKRISLSRSGLDLIGTFGQGQRRSMLTILADVDEPDIRRLIQALLPIVTKLGCGHGQQSEASPPSHEPTHHSNRQEIPG